MFIVIPRPICSNCGSEMLCDVDHKNKVVIFTGRGCKECDLIVKIISFEKIELLNDIAEK